MIEVVPQDLWEVDFQGINWKDEYGVTKEEFLKKFEAYNSVSTLTEYPSRSKYLLDQKLQQKVHFK